MIFPMNEIFHFSQQLSRSRFTGSRWQRIGPFFQSVDPDLSRSLNQFHLLLKSGTFPKQIYTGSPNSSCAPKPLLTNPIAKPRSKPQSANSKLHEANRRSNLEPLITVGASDGGTLECRYGHPWSEGKTLTFADLIGVIT
jgi:hypothetical protein